MSVNPFETVKDIIDTSPKISDEVKTTHLLHVCLPLWDKGTPKGQQG